MSCHFQISLELAPQSASNIPGQRAYLVRLRKDGTQWRGDPLPGTTITIMDQYPVESVDKFPLTGPDGLLEEDDLVQMGWAMRHSREFAKELNAIEVGDRLSIRGNCLDDVQDPRSAVALAKKMAEPLQQRLALQRDTPDTQPKPTPRL